MSIALSVGLLTAAAVYLFMQRGMIRIVLGFILISHAANLIIFSAGNTAFREIPYIGSSDPGQQADPLPQAFVLTAIVIAFSITMFMITLAITTTTDDDTEGEELTPVAVVRSAIDPESDANAELMTIAESDGFVANGRDHDVGEDGDEGSTERSSVAADEGHDYGEHDD